MAEKTIKRGWKKRFAVVQNAQMSLYDKEKDAENGTNGQVVIDLK